MQTELVSAADCIASSRAIHINSGQASYSEILGRGMKESPREKPQVAPNPADRGCRFGCKPSQADGGGPYGSSGSMGLVWSVCVLQSHARARAASAVADGLPDRNWVAFQRHWDWIVCENLCLSAALPQPTISLRPPRHAPSAPIRHPPDLSRFPRSNDWRADFSSLTTHSPLPVPQPLLLLFPPFPLHFPRP